MTYRKMLELLRQAFDQVDHSSIDNEVAAEDKEHLIDIINQE